MDPYFPIANFHLRNFYYLSAIETRNKHFWHHNVTPSVNIMHCDWELLLKHLNLYLTERLLKNRYYLKKIHNCFILFQEVNRRFISKAAQHTYWKKKIGTGKEQHVFVNVRFEKQCSIHGGFRVLATWSP